MWSWPGPERQQLSGLQAQAGPSKSWKSKWSKSHRCILPWRVGQDFFSPTPKELQAKACGETRHRRGTIYLIGCCRSVAVLVVLVIAYHSRVGLVFGTASSAFPYGCFLSSMRNNFDWVVCPFTLFLTLFFPLFPHFSLCRFFTHFTTFFIF